MHLLPQNSFDMKGNNTEDGKGILNYLVSLALQVTLLDGKKKCYVLVNKLIFVMLHQITRKRAAESNLTKQ